MIEKGDYTHTIMPRDVDFSGRATIVSIGDYILNVAGEDADRNGFGVRNLTQNNRSWVLSRMAIQMERMPMQHQTITITTWVNSIGRLMTTRNMILQDAAGQQIGAAVTCWAMIDLNTRHALDLSSHPNYVDVIIDDPSPIAMPCKVARIEPQTTILHKVVYSDIDFNQHTNSMKYVEWMVDMLPAQYHTDRVMHRLEINFMHESKWGDTLEVGALLCDNSLFEIKAADSTQVCRASMSWH